MSGDRTNVPSDAEILDDADRSLERQSQGIARQKAVDQYERSFRRNRDDAIENGVPLICAICGCQDNESEEWDLDHDEPLHAVYDAIKKAS